MRATLSKASPAASSRVLAEHLVAGVVADRGEHRVAAAGDQAEERRLERLGLEEVGGDVALQVVDRDQRQAARRGDRLRRADADQEGADQPRPDRDRDRLDVVERWRPPRPARPRPPAPPARGDAARRPPGRPRRSGRAPPPARRSRWTGSAARPGPPRRCRRRTSRWPGSSSAVPALRFTRPEPAGSARESPANGGRGSPLASIPGDHRCERAAAEHIGGIIQSSHMISASSPLSW